MPVSAKAQRPIAPYDGWGKRQRVCVKIACVVLKKARKLFPRKEFEVMAGSILKKLLWLYSEAFAYKPGRSPYKYLQNPLWTSDARSSLKKYGRVRTKRREVKKRALRFEHVVPRKVLERSLLSRADTHSVERLMRLSIGVVVTQKDVERLDKADRLNQGNDIAAYVRDPWLRYKKASVRPRFQPECTSALRRTLRKQFRMDSF